MSGGRGGRRRRRLAGGIGGLLLALASAAAWGDPAAELPPVKRIDVPVDLAYRAPTHASFTYGRLVTNYTGVSMQHPIDRTAGTVRVDPVGDWLAVTFTTTESWPKPAPGQAPQRYTVRMLIDRKGQVADFVHSDGKATEGVGARPILAQIEHGLSLMLPRFPPHPVKTGDTLYDYEWDVGQHMGFHSGVIVARMAATVRGRTSHNGRDAVAVSYTGRGVKGAIHYDEDGEQYVDIATGLLLGVASRGRIWDGEHSIAWTSGQEFAIE